MTWLQTGAMHLVGHEEVLKGYLLCVHNSLNTAGITMTFKKTLKYIKRNSEFQMSATENKGVQ